MLSKVVVKESAVRVVEPVAFAKGPDRDVSIVAEELVAVEFKVVSRELVVVFATVSPAERDVSVLAEEPVAVELEIVDRNIVAVTISVSVADGDVSAVVGGLVVVESNAEGREVIVVPKGVSAADRDVAAVAIELPSSDAELLPVIEAEQSGYDPLRCMSSSMTMVSFTGGYIRFLGTGNAVQTSRVSKSCFDAARVLRWTLTETLEGIDTTVQGKAFVIVDVACIIVSFNDVTSIDQR